MFKVHVFHSLRTRLIASYAFVIFLSLFLAGSAFIFLLRSYQMQVRLNQLSGLVVPIAYQVWTLERQGDSVAEISALLQEQATETKVRILLVDPQQKVVVDTGGSMLNQSLPLPPVRGPAPRQRPNVYSATYRAADGNQVRLLWLPPRARPSVDELPGDNPPVFSVVLAVQPQDLASAWLQLAPHLAQAGLASLVISILVALFIARSITGPISQVTRAAEAMARGDYDHRIPSAGQDEVGRLATTFNTMAQEVGTSHRTLRDFLANVSHDLRTPLTSIQGFSQAMLDRAIETPTGYTDAARIINDEAARMRRLVEDLLYLSRIESGQVAMEHQRLDLADLLNSCARRFAWLADENGVRLDVEVPPGATVEGDEHYLTQAVANLVENAVRHTPTGGVVRLRGWLAQTPPQDGWTPRLPDLQAGRLVCVAVGNSGSVIPPEDLQRIFERFYQVDKSRAHSGGSGLGLAIVSEIAQAHGGAVTVRSRPEYGTEFLLVLPLSATSRMLRAG